MSQSEPKTAVVWDKRYLLHEMDRGHPESPERLLAIKKVLEEPEFQGRFLDLSPRLATVEEISLLHKNNYVIKVNETAGRVVRLDPDVVTSAESWEVARLAVGGVLMAVDYVLQRSNLTGGNSPSLVKEGVRGRSALQSDLSLTLSLSKEREYSDHPSCYRNAFAFVRPPGHHAEKDRAMGFCIFNNIAIAAEYALQKKGIGRVLIIDFDVHHGNGTQHAFYDRNDVFYISTHRYPFYPGTGARRETGEGAGRGTTLNIPFPGGEGDEEYLKAFEEEIIPAGEAYAPELILVSAGYDAHRRDPLGGMNVTGEGYRLMSQKIVELAKKSCQGRVLFVLEGGYDLEGLAEGVRESLLVLSS